MSKTLPLTLLCEDFPHYFGSAFYGQIYAGILQRVAARGLSIRLLHKTAQLKQLKPSKTQGLIFVGRPSKVVETWLKQKHDFCIVMACHPLQASGIASVTPDGKAGIFSVTQHLIKNGHRKIAYVSGFSLSTDAEGRTRHQGFLAALKKSKIKPRPALVFYHDLHDIKNIDQTFARLLKSKVSAVVFMADVMAYAFYVYCERRKIKIPQDISVVGFDGIARPSGIQGPKLSTYKIDVAALGQAAVDMVLQAKPRSTTFKGRLVSGLSLRDRRHKTPTSFPRRRESSLEL